jgi:CDP-paratose 2-epimerase
MRHAGRISARGTRGLAHPPAGTPPWRTALRPRPRRVLITGGAGFIGTNLAHRLLLSGSSVRVFDNLSRAGVEANLAWLSSRHARRLDVQIGDVRDGQAVARAVEGVDAVFHFAAQVAVTSSLLEPLHDFEVNAHGALNLLEAVRRFKKPPSVVFTSTNKVYGDLADVPLAEEESRYVPSDRLLRGRGIGEDRPLSFHSPYGCSKGAADQYVLDYSRSFAVPALVFRMSCIYGPHQFGTEDQGWIAHFLIRAIAGEPLTVYGDGKQVRDVLFVEDLVDAFLLAQDNVDHLGGQAFNIGGGPANSLSLLELLQDIETIHGQRPRVRYEGWRTGDQRYYVSDTRRFQSLTGWSPRTSARDGLVHLYRWLLDDRAEPGARRSALHALAHDAADAANAARS